MAGSCVGYLYTMLIAQVSPSLVTFEPAVNKMPETDSCSICKPGTAEVLQICHANTQLQLNWMCRPDWSICDNLQSDIALRYRSPACHCRFSREGSTNTYNITSKLKITQHSRMVHHAQAALSVMSVVLIGMARDNLVSDAGRIRSSV